MCTGFRALLSAICFQVPQGNKFTKQCTMKCNYTSVTKVTAGCIDGCLS